MARSIFFPRKIYAFFGQPSLSVGGEGQNECGKRDYYGCKCSPVFGTQIADPADERYKKGLKLLENVGGLLLIFGVFSGGYFLCGVLASFNRRSE